MKGFALLLRLVLVSTLLVSTFAVAQLAQAGDGYLFADRCGAFDIGRQIEICQNMLPRAANGYRAGTIVLPNTVIEPNESAWRTPVTLGPGVNLEGQGLFASSFHCTVEGTACLTHDASEASGPNTHTVFPNTVYRGFTLTGSGASGQSIFHLKDAQGLTIQDVVADGASEEGGACFWLDDVKWWTERNTFFNVSTMYGCRIGWRFTVQSGNPNTSFGYNRFLDIKTNPTGPQMAFSFENNAYVYNSTFRITVNKAGDGAKVIHMQDRAEVYDDEVHLFGEDDGKGGNLFDIASGDNIFTYMGQVNWSGAGNNIAPGAVFTHWLDDGGYGLAGSLWNGTQSIFPVSLSPGTDLDNVSQCGTYAGQSLANTPQPVGPNYIKLQVLCTGISDYISQNVFDAYNPARQWQRVKDDSGWGRWREVAWVDELPSGFSGTRMAGACRFTIDRGVITHVTGCD